MELEIITSTRYLDDHTHIEVNAAGGCLVIYDRCVLETFGERGEPGGIFGLQ